MCNPVNQEGQSTLIFRLKLELDVTWLLRGDFDDHVWSNDAVLMIELFQGFVETVDVHQVDNYDFVFNCPC